MKHDGNYTVMEQATLQEAFLSYLGIQKVHILAHDVGDTVALEMIARWLFFGILMLLHAFILLQDWSKLFKNWKAHHPLAEWLRKFSTLVYNVKLSVLQKQTPVSVLLINYDQ